MGSQSHKGTGAFTEENRKMIIALITNGSSRRMAARYVGIHPSTLSRYIVREPQFCEEVIRAEGNVEIESLRRIREAAQQPRYWRAAAWLLERRKPAEYGQRPAESYSPSENQAFLTYFCENPEPQLFLIPPEGSGCNGPLQQPSAT